MPANMGSNFWVSNFPGGAGNPAAPAYGGGGSSDMFTARSSLDMKRQAAGFAPGASYPDGYLGNVGGRQNDKLAVLQTRLTPDSYHRGVHVGEKQSQGAYYWNQDMNPGMGLARQQTASLVDSEGALVWSVPRFAPQGDPVELLINDGKSPSAATQDSPATPVTQLDPAQSARMRSMLPPWSGVGGSA